MPKTPEEPPKRPRGRPALGPLCKRNMTLRLAVDVAEYLDASANSAKTVEAAVRGSKAFRDRKKSPTLPPECSELG